MEVIRVPTHPIEGQKTGTSGLRKKVSLIESTPFYIENWLQSLMNALAGSKDGTTFILGGDGRYLNDRAMISAIEILFANGVSKITVGLNGLMSTPAVSNLIRQRRAFGGIIMTASHNPAGLQGDWGIKFNSCNGEPALEKITDRIFDESKKILEIRRLKLNLQPTVLTRIGITHFSDTHILEVLNPVKDYVALMKTIFDFPRLKNFITHHPKILFDGMHAVTGIYAHEIFCEEFSLPSSVLQNSTPLSDFGNGHPDPNLVYATDLVARMMGPDAPYLGFASDGDGDRNMIMGSNWFVTPSDSLAIIADYAVSAIPYFAKHGVKGVARSMPTSRAVDAVALRKNFKCSQTPTGWKYFGNLMDAGLVNLCGEESFGTGADHIREKDGIWAALAWLSIIEYANRSNGGDFIGVEAINERHWDEYGRHIYCRCDYEEVESAGANQMMKHIRSHLVDIIGTTLMRDWVVENAEEYSYTDPVDGSVAENQGFIISFTNGSRLVYRLSGTGSSGATVRIYMEHFVLKWRDAGLEGLDKGPMMKLAEQISLIEKFTGRHKPTVIT
jgi:phosphoglucomutase